MKIDSISYERRMADGNYGNRALRMSAFVEEDDDPDAVVLRLITWTREHLEADVRAEEAAREAEYKRRQEEYERQRQEGMATSTSAHPDDGVGEDDIPFDDDSEDDEP